MMLAWTATLIVLCALADASDNSWEMYTALGRSYFGCPDCDPSTCPPPKLLPGASTCELVTEPGVCGCCQTCAREKGDFCGPLTERCGRGFSCQPSPFSENAVEDMFLGKGLCLPSKKSSLLSSAATRKRTLSKYLSSLRKSNALLRS